MIDYEPLPAVVSLEDAVKPGAPAVWDEAPEQRRRRAHDGQQGGDRRRVRQRQARRLAQARQQSRQRQLDRAARRHRPILIPTTTATRCTRPRKTRTAPAPHVAGDVLKVPQIKLRVISPDVGGGFGMKGAVYPEDALVLWASRRCGGRPVKWVSTRSEAFLGDAHGRDQVVTGELALDEHGKILGMRVECAARHGLACIRRVDGRAAVRAQAGARRLRYPGGARRRPGGSHQHAAVAALSRRRPAGGDLS